MELSDNTLHVLKNFASINQNIVITEGQTVSTISDARNIMSQAQLDTPFTQKFGIYDLNEFLNVISLVDTPQLQFDSNYVMVSDTSGRARAKYFFSDPEMLTSPNKEIVMPPPEVSFTLSNSTLNKIKRAASVMGHSEVSVASVDNVICLSVVDSQDKTSNVFSVDVGGEYEQEDFNFIVKIDNLKVIPGDYKVSMSSLLISHFVNEQLPIQYWIALEKNSTYGEQTS